MNNDREIDKVEKRNCIKTKNIDRLEQKLKDFKWCMLKNVLPYFYDTKEWTLSGEEIHRQGQSCTVLNKGASNLKQFKECFEWSLLCVFKSNIFQ